MTKLSLNSSGFRGSGSGPALSGLGYPRSTDPFEVSLPKKEKEPDSDQTGKACYLDEAKGQWEKEKQLADERAGMVDDVEDLVTFVKNICGGTRKGARGRNREPNEALHEYRELVKGLKEMREKRMQGDMTRVLSAILSGFADSAKLAARNSLLRRQAALVGLQASFDRIVDADARAPRPPQEQ